MADLSRHLLESGDLHLLESGDAHLLEQSAVSIYWHNLLGNNVGRDRRNYTIDEAGTTPAATPSDYGTARYWRLRAVAPAEGDYFVLKYLQFWNDGAIISPQNMTSNNSAGFVADQSSFDSAREAWQAFSADDANEYWRPANNLAGEWISLDFGVAVTVDEVRIRADSSVSNRIEFFIEHSSDNTTWTAAGRVGNPEQALEDAEAYCTDVTATDDLLFSGVGTGADDDWLMSGGDVVHVNSLVGSGFGGGFNTPGDSGFEAEGLFNIDRSPANWDCRTRCETINVSALGDWGSSGDRTPVTLRGTSPGITRTGGGSVRSVYWDLVLKGATSITPTGDSIRIFGTITGHQDITVDGSRRTEFRLSDFGRTSDVASVTLTSGGTRIAADDSSTTVIQGIGGTDGEPANCPITVQDNIRFEIAPGGGVALWGNPIVMGSNRQIKLIGSSGASHTFICPITLNANLDLQHDDSDIGLNVDIRGATGFVGTGTPDPNAGLISGTGELTFSTGNQIDPRFRLRVDQGAPFPTHSGNTVISDNTIFEVYGLSGGDLAFAIGTGTVTIDENGKLAAHATDAAAYTISNALFLTGTTGTPTIGFAEGSSAHRFVLGALLTIDSPQAAVIGASPDSREFYLTNGLAIAQDTTLTYDGDTDDFDIRSALTTTVPGSKLTLNTTNLKFNGFKFETGWSIGPDLDIDVIGANGSLVVFQTVGTVPATTTFRVLDTGGIFVAAPTTFSGPFEAQTGSEIDGNSSLRLLGPSAGFGDALIDTSVNIFVGCPLVNFAGNDTTIDLPDVTFLADTTFTNVDGAGTSLVIVDGSNTVDFDTTATLTLGAGVDFRITNPFVGVEDSTITGGGNLIFSPIAASFTIPSEPGVAAAGQGLQISCDLVFSSSAGDGNPADVVFTLQDQSQLKSFKATNDNRNWTFVLKNVILAGDVVRDTNPSAGSGSLVIRFDGVVAVQGSMYQSDGNGTGAHVVQLMASSTLQVLGNFFPNFDLTGTDPANNTTWKFEPGSTLLLQSADARFGGGVAVASDAFDAANLPRVIFDVELNDSVVDSAGAYAPVLYRVQNAGATPRTLTFSSALKGYCFASLSAGSNGTVDVVLGAGSEFHRFCSFDPATDINLVLNNDLKIRNTANLNGFGAIAGQLNNYAFDIRHISSVSWADPNTASPTLGGAGINGSFMIWAENLVAQNWNLDFLGQTKPVVVNSGFVATSQIAIKAQGGAGGSLTIAHDATLVCDTLYGDPAYPAGVAGLAVDNAGVITCYGTVDLNNSNIRIYNATGARYWRVYVNERNGSFDTELDALRLLGGSGTVLTPVDMTSNTDSASHPSAVVTHVGGDTDAYEVFDSNSGSGTRLADNEWVGIDVGYDIAVSQVYFDWDGSRQAPRYRLQWSHDGVSWTDLGHEFTFPEYPEIFTHRFAQTELGGMLEIRPRGAGPLRLMDFGGLAPPSLDIIREAASFAGDEPAYVVATSMVQRTDHTMPGRVRVRNESATIALNFGLGESQGFAGFITEMASTGPVVVDFNGFDLYASNFVFDPNTLITAPAGSAIYAVGDVVEFTAPLSRLPEVFNRADVSLTLQNDLIVEGFYQIFGTVGELDTQGFDIDADAGFITFLDGSVNEANLVGTRFTAQEWLARSVNMNASGEWFVDSVVAPKFQLAVLGYSNALGSGAPGVVSLAVDAGNNTNWLFSTGTAGANAPSGIGIGIGIGFMKKI